VAEGKPGAAGEDFPAEEMMRTAILVALIAFCASALAQAKADPACAQQTQTAWTACAAKGSTLLEQCMTEKVGATCIAAFRSGNADAACNQKVQDAVVPCVKTHQPAIMECLSAQLSVQCKTQLNADAQKLEACAREHPEQFATLCQ
jgi:hypothetical protein